MGYYLFQSHLGSISTSRRRAVGHPARRFNPTLVRLAPRRERGEGDGRGRFNPTLVRLALASRAVEAPPKTSFQSHLGSIST